MKTLAFVCAFAVLGGGVSVSSAAMAKDEWAGLWKPITFPPDGASIDVADSYFGYDDANCAIVRKTPIQGGIKFLARCSEDGVRDRQLTRGSIRLLSNGRLEIITGKRRDEFVRDPDFQPAAAAETADECANRRLTALEYSGHDVPEKAVTAIREMCSTETSAN